MKIIKLSVKNFRTLEDFSVEFSKTYSAICGQNDSGKSNVIRVMENMFEYLDEVRFYPSEREINFKSDYTKWKQTDSEEPSISFIATIQLEKTKDTGLFDFVTTFLNLQVEKDLLDIILKLHYTEENNEDIIVEIDGNQYQDQKAAEVLKRIRSSRCFLLHNSTEQQSPFSLRRSMNILSRDFSPDYAKLMDSVKKTFDNQIEKIAQAQQKEISMLLGRLKEKYSVRLAFPEFYPRYVPVNIALGDSNNDIPLDEWGSGTRNRTRILVTLFKAKQIGDSETSTDKVTPIIVIEEPESFLHPSAQAEFGRVLQDLSKEFDVQVISTTHSPYMLSLPHPESNILLERKVVENSLHSTKQVDTRGENWMQPFGQVLGIDDNEFSPWKSLFFTDQTSILLVEGDTDMEYMKLLTNEEHGDNRLLFGGEIYPYGGAGNLKNSVLLQFIKNRYRKIFITYDLDVEQSVEKSLNTLGFKKGKDYIGIGLDDKTQNNIEGLLPQRIRDKVYKENTELVNILMSSDKESVDSAKNKIKKLLLEEFKNEAIPGDVTYYSKFYKLTEILNNAFRDDKDK